MQNNIKILVGLLVIVGLGGALAYASMHSRLAAPVDSTPYNATLSGTYVCLPHLDTTGPQTEECAFGLKADSGEYYAVNFGQSADSMSQFQSGAHITANGFVVLKEALDASQWQKYNMKGMFTVTNIVEATTSAPSTNANEKLNIAAVCKDALIYMSFTDSKAADAFVAECVAGDHPEVIEKYKADHQLDGATI